MITDSIPGATGAEMLLGFAAVFLLVVWIAFPFLVLTKLNRLTDVCREILKELRKTSSVVAAAAPDVSKTVVQPVRASIEPAAKVFHYAAGDKVTGPVTAAELERLERDHIIDRQTPVYSEHSSEWKPLRDVL